MNEHVTEPRPLNFSLLCVLAIFVGVIAGFGAVLFRWMIALCHNALFLGEISRQYDANMHTAASPWGAWVIFVPVLGAVCVAFLVKTFAAEAKGHGVPEVMDAVYYTRGHIRPVVAVVKSVASAISIGTGGSVGREGPIVQIGAAFASTLGQVVRMPTHQRVWLIAAGAGGGIAATFNTPIGGMLFAFELMLPAVKARSMLIVVLGSATATYIGRIFLGMTPAFNIPEITIPPDHLMNPLALPLLIFAGIVFGLMAALFIKSIYWFEDVFDNVPGNYYTRHCLGMLVVGVMIYVLIQQTGNYYVQGVGYATVVDVLTGKLDAIGFLLLLTGLKLLATCLTLGSGASGGVFSPSLFIGATLGSSIGWVAKSIDPSFPVSPSLFAVAGMAAMVGGTTGALATGITMVFEMTRDLDAVLPLMIVSGICYAVRKQVLSPSIYTLKLLRRKHIVPEGMISALNSVRPVSLVMNTHFKTVDTGQTDVDRSPGTSPLTAKDELVVFHESGVISGTSFDTKHADKKGVTDEKTSASFAKVYESSSLFDALITLDEGNVSVALVFQDDALPSVKTLIGYVDHAQIGRAIGAMAHLQQ